ncbi:protein-glutamate O-methyltransferase CheR [Sphingomonas sp. AP4-R1]|uniref:CheR family methyltransferase n=1 Tax=Sphingomonas sp. AP4-R1 TaxID=2735134 RepID=UPI00149331A3|nr:CheR family methyltransferase [Sphingomonas sp. AP4-R1]QJU58859.1 protein-glutamate O-methyltransferase CheR [Sphingomonas sp. AP4-R1]
MTAPMLVAYERAELRPDTFATISEMAYREAGILLPPTKRELVRSRLARRLRDRRLSRFEDYVRLIATDQDERAIAIDALTTNHTGFFREAHHFDHFADGVRDGLLRRADAGQRVRLWSSACSSGEEPYSLAMTLLGPDRRAAAAFLDGDVRILATDLSTTVIARAKAATYPVNGVAAVPRPLASVWLKDVGDEARVDKACAALVHFRMLNLLGDWPMTGQFDAIFCRNVMIYFDDPTKAKLQRRLVERLIPGGHLYIGHSERLIGPAAEQCRPIGNTIYRKNPV